jgi:hypothetical protein
MQARFALWLALVAGASGMHAADAPAVFLSLDVSFPETPGLAAEAAPRRLILLEDGTVYVGGTRDIAVGRLERSEVRDIEKRLEKIRKQQPGLGGALSFGSAAVRQRLVVAKGKPLDVTASGDPAVAPQALRPIASLIGDLAAFQHPSLRPYRPAFYALSAREGSLPGGCRSWTFPVSISQAVAAPQPLSAGSAGDWPTGGVAASACAGDKKYIVTLRPLLPGEKP